MNFHALGRYLGDYALLGPGILVTIVVSFLAARRLGRALRVTPAVAALLVFSIGLIVSATLTPSREALLDGVTGSGTCQLTPINMAAISAMFQFGDPAFNFLLFVPLGTAIGLLGRPRIRAGAIVAGLLFSPFIELTQLLVTPLDRQCQSMDVLDNVIGLVAGLAFGWVVRLMIDSLEPGSDRPGDSRLGQ